MKLVNILAGAALALAMAGESAQAASFIISYSGQGTSGTARVTGDAVGGGEYDLTSGVLHSTTLGTETLVAPGSGVFKNANSDNLDFDNKIFVPANAPASPDGANLTYAGGLVFQTASPSKKDIYFSANYQGSNNPTISYFAGWDRPSGTLDSFHISAAPEPATWAMMLVGIGGLGAAMRSGRRKPSRAAVAA